MSRPDRNVECNEFFDYPRQPGNNAPHAEELQAVELPNEMIEVWINLNQRNVPDELVTELRTNSLAITERKSRTNIIKVSGIPSEFGFGNQRVLQIVTQHAQNAVFA